MAIRWLAGQPDIQAQVEPLIAELADAIVAAKAGNNEAQPIAHARVLHAGRQRTVYRLDAVSESRRSSFPFPFVAKFHRPSEGVRGLRDRIKSCTKTSSAQRTWRRLCRARSAEIPVPEALALGETDKAGSVLLTRYIEGQPLLQVIATIRAQSWPALCEDIAQAVRHLHQAGLAHGDLHAGNILVTSSGVHFLDLQRLSDATPEGVRQDWARLLFSIERGWQAVEPTSVADAPDGPDFARLLLRTAALGPDFPPTFARFLADHQRGRRRKTHRLGMRWARINAAPSLRGVRLASLSLNEAIEAMQTPVDPSKSLRRNDRVTISQPARPDGSPWLCKRVAAGTWGRVLADRIRGSAAARSFRRAEADRLVSNRTAPCLAYLERRRFGFPLESWLLMEAVGEQDLDAFVPKDEREARAIAIDIALWIADQHTRGLAHLDWKAGNVRISRCADQTRLWIVDHADLRGPASIVERDRIESLVQLNASLDEEHFSSDCRFAALECYAEQLPFSTRLDSVAKEIAEASLMRNHRWKGPKS